MSRNYTALKNGKVVRHGTFTDLELLQVDFPGDQYELVLDQLMTPEQEPAGYAELRRRAYPPDGDLADAIYWQAKGDSSKMDAYLSTVEAVKARYPKV